MKLRDRISKAKKEGYYQPKDVLEAGLYSFQVYESKEKCIEDNPNQEIITYYGNDIQGFVFVD